MPAHYENSCEASRGLAELPSSPTSLPAGATAFGIVVTSSKTTGWEE
jgi:hypothetical protein